MEQNIQSKNQPLKTPFVKRELFKGGFRDLTQFAIDLANWQKTNPGKTGIDYRKYLESYAKCK